MKYFVFLLIFILSITEFKSQKIESIYLFKKTKKYANKYKNFSEKDSLILFTDNTFRRYYNYFGFDELDKKIHTGNWTINKNFLKLEIVKREDTFFKSKNFKSFETIYLMKGKKLISKSDDFKNLKKIK